MKKNVGNVDRAIRIVLGIVVVALFSAGLLSGALGITLIVLAVEFILTSLSGVCPLYTVFGITSCKTNKAS
jgi:hypothetical protein